MKRWTSFLLCLFLSASIWLIYNLSQAHTDIVSQEVVAESNIEGRAGRSSDAVTMSARCTASGFRLLRIALRRGGTVVWFSADDLAHSDGDYYSISSSQLLRYTESIFGPGVKVESFLFDRASFRFIPENNKKVPVRPVKLLSFRPQYSQASQLLVRPDSVIVYGPSEVIGRIEEVYTRTISLSDIHSNSHGEARLETPTGVRLSDDKVEYSFEVSRYVELKASLPIAVRNVPAGIILRSYPTTAEVVFRCVFPIITDPTGIVGCYVDYDEFQGSITGRCVVRHDPLPKGVMECRIDPQVVECVESLENE